MDAIFFRPEGMYLQDTHTLPALKQTVSNKAIERRKRKQTPEGTVEKRSFAIEIIS